MEKTDKQLDDMYGILKGNTSIMFADSGNAPAKLIREFRKRNEKPLLKGAFVEETIFIGDEIGRAHV